LFAETLGLGITLPSKKEQSSGSKKISFWLNRKYNKHKKRQLELQMRMKYLVLASFIGSTLTGYGQSTRLYYTIAQWQGAKAAAVSITFDDCMPSQFENAIPVLNDPSGKIPATFFLTGKSISANAASIMQAYQAGHEIANHSYTHPPKLADLGAAEIDTELKCCQDATYQLFRKPVSYTMAYPNGSGQGHEPKDDAVRKILKNYFIGARATQIKASRINEYRWEEPFTNDSYYRVNSAMMSDSFSVADFSNDLAEAIKKGGWYCATYHGIEAGWIITSKALFAAHIDALRSKRDDLWIATFRDVVAYHKERSSSSLSVVSESPRKWRLFLTDTLPDNTAYNVPLTIRIKIPSAWIIKSIKQNRKTLVYQLEGDIIQFDAVPDAGAIVFKKIRHVLLK
jgi:chitin deacetylase